MRKIAFVAAVCVAIFGVAAQAQQNSAVNLLDSPVKTQNEVYNAGEVIQCSIALPGTAALFGCDTLTGSSGPVIMYSGELFGAFRVWEYDEGCTPTATWSTAFAGGTMTGLASPNGDTTKYWVVNPGGSADQHNYGVGTATGTTVPLVATGLLGAGVIDDNVGGEILCVDDIVLDNYTCVDLNAAGAFVCSFANADNTGSGAYGNSIGDAVTPGDCGGGTLVAATGSIGEGQVTRVGQYTCPGGVDPGCTDRWSVAAFSTFTNGIEEFDLGGTRTLHMLDNAGSTVFILQQPVGIADCQDIDADMDLVYCNASQGGANYSVDVATAGTLSVANQRTGAGNGKFVHQMWAGVPDGSTVAPLFDLGNACNSFLGGAVVVENNVGKTNIVGASNYFGAGISDPAKAPTFLGSLLQASIDTANLSAGSQWTHQAIHLNGSASSKKGGSLSNALIMNMQ
jgi:hypothetical protein